MTLTEKWKNGELPDGFYYFRMPDGTVEIANEYKLIRYKLSKDADKIEILAPVQSYEELQQMKEDNRLFEDKIQNSYQKIGKLRQLLKECQHMIIAYSINNNTFTKDEVKDIITKTDEVLK